MLRAGVGIMAGGTSRRGRECGHVADRSGAKKDEFLQFSLTIARFFGARPPPPRFLAFLGASGGQNRTVDLFQHGGAFSSVP
jgi:hypothetical protein